MNRTLTSQMIQFKGNATARRPNEQQVNLMQMHGFRFHASEKFGDHWTMEYTRIVTRFEAVPRMMLERLGKQFKSVDTKESVVFNDATNKTSNASAM